MNTTIIIIGIVLVAAFIIPMMIINNHGKAVKVKKEKALDDLAKSNGLTINESEYFKEMTLSLDRHSRKLIYLSAMGNKIVDLNAISIVKLDRKYENEEKKIIGSIDIILSSKDESIVIPFYDHSKKNQMDLYERNESSKIWLKNIETCKA